MKRSGRAIGIFVVALFIGIVMLFESFGDSMKIFKNDIENISGKEKSSYEIGQLVNGKVSLIDGEVAEKEYKRTVYGVPVSTQVTPYYAVYVNYDEDTWENGYYVIVHATKKASIERLEKLDREMRNLYNNPNYVPDLTPYMMEFKVVGMSDDLETYVNQFFSDYTQEEKDRYLVKSVVLEETDYNTRKLSPFGGAAVIIISVVVFILTGKGGKRFARTHYVNEAPAIDRLKQQYGEAPSNTAPVKRYSDSAYGNTNYMPSSTPTGQNYYSQQPQQVPYSQQNPYANQQNPHDQTSGSMDSIDTNDIYR